MKPPIQYFGAKGLIAEQIVRLMPAHEGYVEPFAGSLAVLLAKAPSRVEIMNDLDHHLMTFWRVLRDRPDELCQLAELTPHSRMELDRAQALDATDDLELARQVWVMLTQGRSRTLKRAGWRFFADTDTRSSGFATYMNAYRERLLPAASRIRDVSLECRPAIEMIRQYGAFSQNLLYVDPPYLHGTRQGGRYPHEMSRDEHRELADALHACNSAVMLSGYASDLYGELYAGWHQVAISTHSGNAVDPSRREVVWSNRELEPALFDLATIDDERDSRMIA